MDLAKIEPQIVDGANPRLPTSRMAEAVRNGGRVCEAVMQSEFGQDGQFYSSTPDATEGDRPLFLTASPSFMPYDFPVRRLFFLWRASIQLVKWRRGDVGHWYICSWREDLLYCVVQREGARCEM
jgi:hypothetical protein